MLRENVGDEGSEVNQVEFLTHSMTWRIVKGHKALLGAPHLSSAHSTSHRRSRQWSEGALCEGGCETDYGGVVGPSNPRGGEKEGRDL